MSARTRIGVLALQGAFAAHATVLARLGVTGFCWGGRMTWMYTAHNPSVRGAVAWYGPLVRPATELQPKNPIDIADSLKIPVLGLYGGADQGIPNDTVDKMRAALKAAANPSEIVLYPDTPHGFLEEHRAIGALPFRVGIGEQHADVAQRRRAQQRIAQSMQQGVRIRMAVQAPGVRDLDPAEDQLPALDKLVDIVADADVIHGLQTIGAGPSEEALCRPGRAYRRGLVVGSRISTEPLSQWPGGQSPEGLILWEDRAD